MTEVRRGGYAMYPAANRRAARDLCTDAESFFDFGHRAREPLISFAMDVLQEVLSSDAPRIDTFRRGRSALWIMKTPALRLVFDTFRTSNGCVMLRGVTTPGAEVGARVSAGRDMVRVDLGSVEGQELEIHLGFGDEVAVHAEPASSVYIPLDVDSTADGYYVVLVRGRGGRLLAAEGHSLAAPSD